jgi:hypothetical protein
MRQFTPLGGGPENPFRKCRTDEYRPRQIEADAALIAGGQIRGAHWHFFRGASDDVLAHLCNRGIRYTVHP